MNIVAVSGSYRKGGVTDRMVRAVAEGARQAGAGVDELFIRDVEFDYCQNCRTCWDPAAAGPVGPCPIDDGLTPWLARIAAADGLILGSPVNLGVLTAVFKKFSERCAALAVLTPLPRLLRWLTGMPAAPACRVKRRGRTMVWVTGSLAPSLWGRLLMKGRRPSSPASATSGRRGWWISCGSAGSGRPTGSYPPITSAARTVLGRRWQAWARMARRLALHRALGAA